MDKKNERGLATRQQIVSVATRLFAEEGYEAASIELVLRTCGISRGALYHHFASKEALFAAVLEAAEAQIAATIQAAAQEAANPLDALRAGGAAWLQLTRDPTVRRIVLLDAPSVVGWQAWREMDNRYGLGLLKAALGMAAAAGRLPGEMVDVCAHVLLAALIEVSLVIARADDEAAALRTGQEAVERLLSGMVGVEPHGAW